MWVLERTFPVWRLTGRLQGFWMCFAFRMVLTWSTVQLLHPLSSEYLCTNESVINYCRNHQRIKRELRPARQSLRNKQAEQPGGNPTQANECREELYRRRATLRLPHTSVLSRNFVNQFYVTVRAAGKSRTVFGSAVGAEHDHNGIPQASSTVSA